MALADTTPPTAVAPGVQRIGTSLVNWYVVEDGGRVTVVDAALPRYRPQLDDALGAIGRTIRDVEAVVLTHAHPDHVGCADKIRSDAGARVLIHEHDAEAARTGKPTRGERGFTPYLRKPA